MNNDTLSGVVIGTVLHARPRLNTRISVVVTERLGAKRIRVEFTDGRTAVLSHRFVSGFDLGWVRVGEDSFDSTTFKP